MQPTAIQIRHATVIDAPIVTAMVERLFAELGGFHEPETEKTIALCEQLLATDQYTALLASDETGTVLGVLTLAEVHALYVTSRLGWIQELYVAPEARSLRVGHLLIEEATRYGRARGWQRLEVNTPDAQEWPRTVAFYRREGFVGGSLHLRKLAL